MVIVRRHGRYCLLSKKTHRNLGCYRTRAGAERRERQVQYFKHRGRRPYANQRPPLFTVEPAEPDGLKNTQDVFIDGKHVGTYRVQLTGPDTANIAWVGIRADYQGQGYGRMVAEKILYDLKVTGIRRVFLASLVESVGFWEKMGFTPLAGFPRWHGDTIVWMEKRL